MASFATSTIRVASYHVSSKSDILSSDEDLIGIVLYSNNGQTEWYCNGVECKSGYIFVQRKTEPLSKNSQAFLNMMNQPQSHSGVYKSVFGKSPTDRIIASGFDRIDGEWKHNSFIFNRNNTERAMAPNESEWIEKAIQNWVDYGEQNIVVVNEADGLNTADFDDTKMISEIENIITTELTDLSFTDNDNFEAFQQVMIMTNTDYKQGINFYCLIV